MKINTQTQHAKKNETKKKRKKCRMEYVRCRNRITLGSPTIRQQKQKEMSRNYADEVESIISRPSTLTAVGECACAFTFHQTFVFFFFVLSFFIAAHTHTNTQKKQRRGIATTTTHKCLISQECARRSGRSPRDPVVDRLLYDD